MNQGTTFIEPPPSMLPKSLPVFIGFILLFITHYIYRNGRSNVNNVWHKMEHIKKLLQDNKKKYTVRLISKLAITHDTFRYRFDLGNKDIRLGLPVGKCLKVFGTNIAYEQKSEEWNPRPEMERNGTTMPRDSRPHQTGDMDKDGNWKEMIERKYTPSTLDSDLGYFEFTIKTYRANDSKIFPNGGKFSQYMESLKVGDDLIVQGPFGRMEYLGRSEWKGKYGTKKHLGLIAGGSGVTPMLQLIQAVLSDPEDKTTLSLLYANKTVGDIIVKEQLDTWAKDSKGQFTVAYTLDNPPTDGSWKDQHSGFISADMINKTLPEPSDETLIVICGPPPMVKFACLPNLEKLKYNMKNGVGEF